MMLHVFFYQKVILYSKSQNLMILPDFTETSPGGKVGRKNISRCHVGEKMRKEKEKKGNEKRKKGKEKARKRNEKGRKGKEDGKEMVVTCR